MKVFSTTRLCVLIPLILLFGLFNSLEAQIKPIKPFGKIRALVVGISDYQNDKIPDLSYAHKDAEVFAHFLENETGWKVDSEDIVLLTNENATYGKFISELKAITETCQPKDRLIIYFSGHGDIEKVEKDPMGYLLFYDVSPTTYSVAGACMVTTLNQHLQDVVTEKQTEVILITDACRSGTLAGSSIGGQQATAAALLNLFQKTVKILSCEPDQVSLEGDWGGGRGLFSYHLINGLKGLADEDENLFVDLYELKSYVQDSVRKHSNRRQIPTSQGGSSGMKVSKVNPKVLSQIQPENPVENKSNRDPILASQSDTSYLSQLAKFQEALARKQLLFPENGSAYQIYQSLGDHPAAQPIKKVMNISLSTALQDEAQQALNEYVTSPGKELVKRWSNSKIYTYYPDYLGKAAELLGKEYYFYNDVKSREHYFRGVNLRLKADAEKSSDSLLQLALKEQQTALQLQPIAPHIFNEMGLLHRRMGQHMQAISFFQRALALSPKWSLVLSNLGLTYQEQKLYPQAEKILKDAISLDTTLAISHYNLALLYEEMEKNESAISELKKTIQYDPTFDDAYYNLAYYYIGDPNKYSEAAEALIKYIQLKPNDPDGYSLLGYIYLNSDQLEKARQTYESVSVIDSSSYTISSLANVYQKLKEFDLATGVWEKYIKRFPDDHNAYLQLARSLTGSKKYDLALEKIKFILTKGFKDFEALNKYEDLKPLKDRKDYQELIKQYFPEKK